MSLDETSLKVWETTRPPLAVLVAGRATNLLASRVAAQVRGPFDELATALVTLWPKRKRQPKEIYENEYAACIEVAEAAGTVAAKRLLAGATLQMAALLKAVPRSVPAEGLYNMGEDEFRQLLRDAAKAGKIPLAQFDARLKVLLEHKRDRWSELVACADRMSWEPGVPWGKLDKRVKALVSLADLGATASWSEVGSQRLLRLELDGTKRIAALSEDELAALTRVIPTITIPD